MSWVLILLIFFVSLIVLMLSGIPVVTAFLTVSGIGALVFYGGFRGLSLLSLTCVHTVSNWSLLPIPLFILMGELLFRSGIASKAIDIVDMWMGRLPGRLAVVAVGSATLMGTFTGSSMATTSMLGSTLVPEMERRGYHPLISLGAICGAGGLALMIPPSGSIVFISTVANISIGQMLMGGIVPGLIMATGYISYVIIRCKFQPHLAPAYKKIDIPMKRKLVYTALNLVPLLCIIMSISGVILFGIATPSEAAATGAIVSLIVAICYKKMSLPIFKSAVIATCRTSAMLLVILLGSASFSAVLAFSGATRGLVEWVATLQVAPIVIVISLLGVVLVMGCFMEVKSIVMITIPIFMPIIKTIGFNEIVFLLMFVVDCEMAESTPPFGVLLFLLRGMYPKIPMKTIMNSAWPFLIADLVAIIFMMIFPEVTMWLPNIAAGR